MSWKFSLHNCDKKCKAFLVVRETRTLLRSSALPRVSTGQTFKKKKQTETKRKKMSRHPGDSSHHLGSLRWTSINEMSRLRRRGGGGRVGFQRSRNPECLELSEPSKRPMRRGGRQIRDGPATSSLTQKQKHHQSIMNVRATVLHVQRSEPGHNMDKTHQQKRDRD